MTPIIVIVAWVTFSFAAALLTGLMMKVARSVRPVPVRRTTRGLVRLYQYPPGATGRHR